MKVAVTKENGAFAIEASEIKNERRRARSNPSTPTCRGSDG
jgi:hypothetical protein